MARGNINFERSGSADEIEFARSSIPSKYTTLIEEVARLNHKQTVTIPVAQGDNPEKARLRIRQALNRYLPEELTHVKRFEVRKSSKGKIVIVCVLLSRDA